LRHGWNLDGNRGIIGGWSPSKRRCRKSGVARRLGLLKCRPRSVNSLSKARRYYLTIANLAAARGPEPDLSFRGSSPQGFAEALQQALRQNVLFQRWKARQPEPDEVDDSLAPVDPGAIVTARQDDLHTDVEVVTTLPHAILRHRLFILIGPNWQLRDVRDA
jgi:hypothetical protein